MNPGDKHKHDRQAERLTEQALREAQEDIFSTEERARLEALLDSAEYWIIAIVQYMRAPDSTALNIELEAARDELIKAIEKEV